MVDTLANAFNMILSIHNRSVTIERLGSSELVSGLDLPISVDLTSTISEGVAYILGTRLVVPEAIVTFTASKDTYIDITPLGVLTYSEVVNGGAAPTIALNNIRVCKVVTDLTAIISVTRIAKYRSLYAISPTAIKVSPGNYFRNLAGPEETTIDGREFVISKAILDSAFFPHPTKGDRLKDPVTGTSTITEVREMYGLGGTIFGYRVRTS